MIKKLLYINGLAIISVVLYHASARGFISMFWWAHRYRPVGSVNFDQLGNAEYFSLRFIEQLVIFAIPSFIFVSGYFIAVAAGKNKKTVGWDIVLNRIKFLAVPFVLWSLINILFSVAQGNRFSLIDILLIVVTGRAANPYYFIPLLVQFYLLSPLLVFWINNWWKPVLVISALIQILILILRTATVVHPDLILFSYLSKNIFFTSYIFWFVLGIVVGFHQSQFKTTLSKFKLWFLIGVVFFFILGVFEWEMLFRFSGREWIPPAETLVDHFYALSFLLAFFTYDNLKLPLIKRITSVGSRSFAIYLVHSLVLTLFAKLIYHFAPLIMEYQILFQSILVLSGLGIPLLLTRFVEKSFLREYYRYILG